MNLKKGRGRKEFGLNQPRKFHTVVETADELHLSHKTIRAWIATRRLAVVRLGRVIRVPDTELQRLINEGTIPARTDA